MLSAGSRSCAELRCSFRNRCCCARGEMRLKGDEGREGRMGLPVPDPFIVEPLWEWGNGKWASSELLRC